jgi:SnoaL-like domain
VHEPAVSDELEIHRVLYDYAWACDNEDWGLLSSVFTADAQLDYSSTDGPADGRDEVVGWCRSH